MLEREAISLKLHNLDLADYNNYFVGTQFTKTKGDDYVKLTYNSGVSYPDDAVEYTSNFMVTPATASKGEWVETMCTWLTWFPSITSPLAYQRGVFIGLASITSSSAYGKGFIGVYIDVDASNVMTIEWICFEIDTTQSAANQRAAIARRTHTYKTVEDYGTITWPSVAGVVEALQIRLWTAKHGSYEAFKFDITINGVIVCQGDQILKGLEYDFFNGVKPVIAVYKGGAIENRIFFVEVKTE